MRKLALALLIPVAICTACSRNEDSGVTTDSAPVDAPVDAPARVDTAPAPPATATAPAAEPAPLTAHATLTAAPGSTVEGGFTFVHQGSAISIRGEIKGLAPGSEHGFHIHEVGECTLPDFRSAGEHFNPTKDSHGGPESSSRHLGDLQNVKADESGRALVDLNAEGLTLADKDGAPTEIIGKAIVVHARRDDYKSQPAGDSGDRIACGVIR